MQAAIVAKIIPLNFVDDCWPEVLFLLPDSCSGLVSALDPDLEAATSCHDSVSVCLAFSFH